MCYIKAAQLIDDWCRQKAQKVQDGVKLDFHINNGILKFKGKVYVPFVN